MIDSTTDPMKDPQTLRGAMLRASDRMDEATERAMMLGNDQAVDDRDNPSPFAFASAALAIAAATMTDDEVRACGHMVIRVMRNARLAAEGEGPS